VDILFGPLYHAWIQIENKKQSSIIFLSLLHCAKSTCNYNMKMNGRKIIIVYLGVVASKVVHCQ